MIQEIIDYYLINRSYVWDQVIRHFLTSFYGVLFAVLVAVPLGFYIAKRPGVGRWLIRLASAVQAVPALALLSLLIVVVGLGPNTVVVAIFLYSLLPILENTYTAVTQVSKEMLDVAKSMGMTSRQILFKIEFPLSISMILGGIRNALVVAIGVAAVGTFIGAGGLGDIISRGLNVTNGSAIVWAGALPTALMALLIELVFSRIEKMFTR